MDIHVNNFTALAPVSECFGMTTGTNSVCVCVCVFLLSTRNIIRNTLNNDAKSLQMLYGRHYFPYMYPAI